MAKCKNCLYSRQLSSIGGKPWQCRVDVNGNWLYVDPEQTCNDYKPDKTTKSTPPKSGLMGVLDMLSHDIKELYQGRWSKLDYEEALSKLLTKAHTEIMAMLPDAFIPAEIGTKLNSVDDFARGMLYYRNKIKQRLEGKDGK